MADETPTPTPDAARTRGSSRAPQRPHDFTADLAPAGRPIIGGIDLSGRKIDPGAGGRGQGKYALPDVSAADGCGTQGAASGHRHLDPHLGVCESAVRSTKSRTATKTRCLLCSTIGSLHRQYRDSRDGVCRRRDSGSSILGFRAWRRSTPNRALSRAGGRSSSRVIHSKIVAT